MIKKIGFCLVLTLKTVFLYSQSQAKDSLVTPEIGWQSLKAADAAVCDTLNTKKIYVFFDTDWCAACRMMEQNAFKNTELVNYLNDHFICVKFNAELLDTVRFKGQLFGKTTHNGWLCNAFAALYLDQEFAFPSHLILNEKGGKMGASGGAKTTWEMLCLLSFFEENHYKTTDFSAYSEVYTPPSWKGKKRGRSGTTRKL